MAILYKNNPYQGILVRKAQQGLQMENPSAGYVDGNSKPMADRRTYRSKAVKGAPFLTNWLQDPITVNKMNKQFGQGVSGKMQANIDKLGLVDMRKLGSLSNIQFRDFAHGYSTGKNLRPANRAYKENTAALSRMRQYGQQYDPETGKGVHGVRIPGFKGIGTIYDISNPDQYGTATHELTHGTGYQNLAEKFIADKWGSKQIPYENLKGMGFDEGTDQLNYLREIGVNDAGKNKEGVYPRIMQLRKMLNVTPGQQVTPEMLKNIQFEDKKSPLRGLRANWDDATIIDIMNTVAENKRQPSPYTMMS